MRSISDVIEQYLKGILDKSPEQMVEIQRNDLAQQFDCVPSQINYVISTRFTLEKGYLVQSKRGGGGYIRIQKISLPSKSALHAHLLKKIGNEIDQQSAEGILFQLEEGRFITEREYHFIRAALSREVLNLSLPYRDQIRARMLKAVLTVLLKYEVQ